jgi:hypothetical protein
LLDGLEYTGLAKIVKLTGENPRAVMLRRMPPAGTPRTRNPPSEAVIVRAWKPFSPERLTSAPGIGTAAD